MKYIRCLAMLLLVALLMQVPFVTVSSQEAAAITIHYTHGPCTFDFYRIADFSPTNGLTLTPPFAAYTQSVTALDALGELGPDELRTLSTTLEAVVLRDGVTPTYTAVTDDTGTLTLSQPELGVYLVLGESTCDDAYRYIPAPILVSIPNHYEGDAWQYQITVEHNKLEKYPTEDTTLRYRVLKIWADDGNESRRPADITVQLLQNGAVYDTVLLNAENNWAYQWADLPADGVWTAVEQAVPEGYSLTVEKEATGIVLTNTHTSPPPPGEDLPPTGQIWWPVPILLVAGLVLLILGLSLSKNNPTER